MSAQVNREALRGRLQSHLTDHYVQLHTTLVSISLGAAGFSAASLATASAGQPDSGFLVWLMWVAGLLAIAVVYVGTVTGGFVLPPGIPAVWDLIIPMGIGLSQFLIFGFLTRSVAPFSETHSMVGAWLLTMGSLGALSVVGILRARYLIRVQDYEGQVGHVVNYYRGRLRSDAVGAAILAFISAASGLYLTIDRTPAPLWFYVAVSGVITILLFGLIQHHLTGRKLQRILASYGTVTR